MRIKSINLTKAYQQIEFRSGLINLIYQSLVN